MMLVTVMILIFTIQMVVLARNQTITINGDIYGIVRGNGTLPDGLGNFDADPNYNTVNINSGNITGDF